MAVTTFTSEEAIDLWHEGWVRGFVQEELEFIEEWRWGNSYYVIIRHEDSGKLFAAPIRVQTGDHYHVSWEDDSIVEFQEVKKVEKVVHEYVPV